jgi:NADH:ubiquinone oxidoreductase subunit 6 (subunit J)
MGRLFLTDHLLAFEITSIVLLVAAVGGVVLGMRSEDEALVDAGRGERA